MRVSGDKKSPRTSKVRDDAVRVRRFVRSEATEERVQAKAGICVDTGIRTAAATRNVMNERA